MKTKAIRVSMMILVMIVMDIPVGDIGFEPTTSTMSTLRSNQLS